MTQLLVHILGDYFVQSDWMALNKNKRTWPCVVHVILYTACFLLLTTSWRALLFIGVTHFFIDRFGLARYIIWLKNHLDPHGYPRWSSCNKTGYFDEGRDSLHHASRPLWITVWLYIISDNALHLACNALALSVWDSLKVAV